MRLGYLMTTLESSHHAQLVLHDHTTLLMPGGGTGVWQGANRVSYGN